MYSPNKLDPVSYPDASFVDNPHSSKPVYLMHRNWTADEELPVDVKIWDLRNYQVNIRFSPLTFKEGYVA